MGVSHLRRDASLASGTTVRGDTRKSVQSQQVTSGDQFKRPAETSGTRTVPEVPSVNSFEDRAVKPGNSVAQPPHDGGPAGSKSGQEHIGDRSGNKKDMSGGAAGGPVGR